MGERYEAEWVSSEPHCKNINKVGETSVEERRSNKMAIRTKTVMFVQHGYQNKNKNVAS